MDKSNKIFKILKEHLNYIKNNYPSYNILFIILKDDEDDLGEDVNHCMSKMIVTRSAKEIMLDNEQTFEYITVPNNKGVCEVLDIQCLFKYLKSPEFVFQNPCPSKYKIITDIECKPLILKLLEYLEKTPVKEYSIKFFESLQLDIMKIIINEELNNVDVEPENINPNDYENVFVTSDLHFGHKNILEYEHRLEKMGLPISTYSIEYHDEQLIKNWNSIVNKKDLVYILGDFSFKNYMSTMDILEQLNGDKVLIEGNHDIIYLQNKKFNKKLYKEISSYKEIEYKGNHIVLSHYPIKCFKNQNKDTNRYIHLCGHIHSVPIKLERGIYNVGVDVNNYRPVPLDVAVKRALNNIEGVYNTDRSIK